MRAQVKYSVLTALAAALAIAGGAAMAATERLNVQSPDFGSNAAIPSKYSEDGQDISPALVWSKAPKTAKSLVVTCTDPDAPGGVWWHWIMFNLAPETTSLRQNQSKSPNLGGGTAQGTNDFGKVGYNGPAPPAGKVHHYHFAVYALDTKLNLRPGCSKGELTAALNGHVVASGEHVGTYVRH